MYILSDCNLWFNKMYVLFVEKEATVDIVVKPVVGWKLVIFSVHHIRSHDTFIQYKPKMRFVKNVKFTSRYSSP